MEDMKKTVAEEQEPETAAAESAADQEAEQVTEQTPASEAESTEGGADTAESDEESQDDAPEEAPKKKKKKFFGKAEPKPSEAELKLAEMTDRVQRTMAEFDNFRKRTEKEKAAMYEVGARSVIEKMLPVVDSFERGLAGISPELKEEPFAAGMDMVYRQLLKAFEELGVTAIEAVGQEFDPNRHNAVMHIEDESLGENIVAEEFQKGYMYRDTVIRYSMVKVAN